MTHEQKKQAAIDAIRELHADTSVPIQQTLDSMTEVAEVADEIISTLEEEVY